MEGDMAYLHIQHILFRYKMLYWNSIQDWWMEIIHDNVLKWYNVKMYVVATTAQNMTKTLYNHQAWPSETVEHWPF